jgi:aminoglycoside phosphotransferase (APT) family kinase protein
MCLGTAMELLARGRSADVYALDDSWVLRRYFVDNDTSVEAAVMAYVREHGVPVPLVRSVNRTDMVLERIHGPTMGEAMLAGRLALDEAAHQLADLHKRLHAVPSRTADLAARVLHMDIHPYNVMMSDTGPVLIDWCNVRDGPPELDVAMTALILAEQVAAGAVESSVIRSFIGGFLAVADGDAIPYLEAAVPIRGSDVLLADEEVARLAAAADVVRDCAP